MRLSKVAAAAALLAALLVPGVASAHPLGNFTVNHYSRIEPAADRVRVVYVLDMAEIPTFQEKPRIDPNPDGYADQRAEELRQNVHLELNGQPAPLRLEQRTLSFPEGAGGLPTLRLEAVFSAALPANASSTVDLGFRDDNDPTRIGWREIVARPGAEGTTIQPSSVPADDVTNELRQYPADLLSSPMNVREAHLSFVPGLAAVAQTDVGSVPAAVSGQTGVGPVSAAGLGQADDIVGAVPGAAFARPALPSTGLPLLDRANSAFADLANGGELTPAFVLFALGVAIVLGAAHALQPGHGKTVVAAYLVGSRGTAKHALFLGATVTATHTAGVYALGIVTLFLSQYIVPERLYPILEVVSGLLVVGIGAWLLAQRLLAAFGLRAARGHDHEHPHAHGAGHEHSHRAVAPPRADLHSHADDHDYVSAGGFAHAHATVSATRAELHSYADDHDHAHSVGLVHSHAAVPTPLADVHAHSEVHGHHQHADVAPQAKLHSHSSGRAHSDTAKQQVAAELHSHGGGRPHSHVPGDGPVGWKSLLALGVSGGLLPCPEALMVLLITIAAHRVLFGLLLIVAFSTGLAGVLVAFGLLLVYARGLFGRMNLSSGLVPRLLPVASALVIVIAGGVITAQALPQVL